MTKGQDVSLKLTNNPGAPTDAFHFYTKTSDKFTTQCGNTTIPETPDTPTTRVCMRSTNLPDVINVAGEDCGKTITFVTAVRTSLDSADPEANVAADYAAAVELQENVETKGVPTPLQTEHIAAWAQLWNAGIEFEGARPDAAIAVNASLYAILSSVRDDWPYGLAPGGLTNYYSGHSFWDTETWMYPGLLLMRPSTARSLVQYRFNRLDGAYQKAKTYSPPYDGAMFPWESAFTGVETCPLWADTGLREQHISADIALAVWQYWSVTQDRQWLQDIAFPILKGVADFLVSRVTMETKADGTQIAHIYDVIPPDEYVSHANDSAYTNYGAACALRYAVQAAEVLQVQVPTAYSTVADALVVLFDPTLNIHPEYQGYPGDTIKQADVVLLHYPWNMAMPDDVRRSDLEYYSTRSDKNGPAMTWGMHMIGYKDLQMLPEAAQFFNRSFQDNMHAPFNVWSETPQGNAGNFITGAGGFLQTMVQGYPGLRITDQAIEMTYPVCPEGVTGVKLRNVGYLGSSLTLSYTCNAATTAACPSVANTIELQVNAAGKVPLQFVALDASTGAVTATYTLVQGHTTTVSVPCLSSGVPKFALQAAV
jgi:trehalose/maltose hydrolase-like predicted phosphorylase